jgi:DNA polymerase-3 subunit epsilon
MFDFLSSEKARRKKLLQNAPEGPLKEYLSTPLPDRKSDINTVPLLALDFETSGLNVSEDSILSVGYVAINDGEIRLSTACHRLIKSNQALPEENVVIHKITDDIAATGESLGDVIGGLLQALSGKVMLAHHAKIETEFLKQACMKLYGISPEFPVIDTMKIARQWFERRNREISQGDLRLSNLRARYGLPSYQAHNALSDSLATAELLQAQVAHMDSKGKLPLNQFLK